MATTTQYPLAFLPPTQLKPYYRNAKKHDKANVQRIAALLAKYGFDQPIVVDGDHVIIKGHGRYMAAVQLNLKLVPTIVRADLSPAEAAAARIADNRIFELGQVDDILVKAELADFMAEGGQGAEVIFDFLKPEPVKPVRAPGLHVTVSDSKQPAHKGSLEVCPKCNYTFWEQTHAD